MVAVRWASLMLTLLCVGIAVATWTANSVLILALVFLAIYTWSVDGFKWATWCADAETSARLSRVDDQLDFEESVLDDLSHIGSERDPRS